MSLDRYLFSLFSKRKSHFKHKQSYISDAEIVQIYAANAPGRERVESFIKARFLTEHDASVSDFLPTLIAVESIQGDVLAAAGIRCGHDDQFFLENYLDASVEFKLTQIRQQPIDRRHIAEIGNLASSSLRSSRQLFHKLFEYCLDKQYEWVVFTSCRRLRMAFRHLNIPLLKLANANASSIEHQTSTWGSYYADKPAVMAGLVVHGKPLARSVPIASGEDNA